jgi:hypothetical protein
METVALIFFLVLTCLFLAMNAALLAAYLKQGHHKAGQQSQQRQQINTGSTAFKVFSKVPQQTPYKCLTMYSFDGTKAIAELCSGGQLEIRTKETFETKADFIDYLKQQQLCTFSD